MLTCGMPCMFGLASSHTQFYVAGSWTHCSFNRDELIDTILICCSSVTIIVAYYVGCYSKSIVSDRLTP